MCQRIKQLSDLLHHSLEGWSLALACYLVVNDAPALIGEQGEPVICLNPRELEKIRGHKMMAGVASTVHSMGIVLVNKNRAIGFPLEPQTFLALPNLREEPVLPVLTYDECERWLAGAPIENVVEWAPALTRLGK